MTATVPAVSAAHFTATRADLVKALALAAGFTEKKTTIPILGNVKISADDVDGLQISATNLEQYFFTQCSASVRSEGEITLPAKRLLDLVRLLPDGEISIKADSKGWATITAGRSKSRIPGIPVESYPERPWLPADTFSVAVAAFAKLIRQTKYAISDVESRFTLTGALLEVDSTGLVMVATDGHRLAKAECLRGPELPAKKCLIPKGALEGFLRLAGEAKGDAEVIIGSDGTHVSFEIGEHVLISRRMSGEFPDYHRTLPNGYPHAAVANREELRNVLARVANFADERSRSVRLQIGNGSVMVSASRDTGDSEESIDAEVSGEMLAGFNAKYLMDALDSFSTETVRIIFKDEKSSAAFEPVGGEERCICIVMPMRI